MKFGKVRSTAVSIVDMNQAPADGDVDGLGPAGNA
jgi:hypothetical protein